MLPRAQPSSLPAPGFQRISPALPPGRSPPAPGSHAALVPSAPYQGPQQNRLQLPRPCEPCCMAWDGNPGAESAMEGLLLEVLPPRDRPWALAMG